MKLRAIRLILAVDPENARAALLKLSVIAWRAADNQGNVTVREELESASRTFQRWAHSSDVGSLSAR